MTSAKRHVLIVEDSRTQAEALRSLLDDADFSVAVVHSGPAALAALHAHATDVVISDVIMPGMNGFELCRALRSDASLQDIPFILLTSLIDPLDVVRGLECGADNYVTKPYDPDQLLRRIARTLESQELRRTTQTDGPIEINFLGSRFSIAAGREQILDVLISSFEDIVRANTALREGEVERARLFERERQARVEAEDARNRAEEANRTKSQFLAMMSHDLRTPLNAIGGYADILEMGLRGPVTESQRADLGRIRTNQRHLLLLVNDVLSFAKVEAGTIPLNLQSIDLDATARPLGVVIEPQAVARQISYEYVGCAQPARVTADSDRLEQILINLLTNAVKFTRTGGRISMRCITEGTMGAIEITDTGIGIAADQLEKIFDPFVQLDAKGGKREGVGLGLAISRSLTAAMGGDIRVQSTVGVGSTFTVLFPLVKADPHS